MTALAALALVLTGTVSPPRDVAMAAPGSPAVQYTNPSQRANPHIVRHTDGFYYLAGRYLRHSSFQLLVQPVDNATARADATYYAE
jgi:hypothetical protein